MVQHLGGFGLFGEIKGRDGVIGRERIYLSLESRIK